MKDKILLIVVGCVAAVGAWSFWHYSGENSFAVLNIVMFVLLFGENYQLRKQVKELKSSNASRP